MNDSLIGLFVMTGMLAILGFYLVNRGFGVIKAGGGLSGKIVSGMGLLFVVFSLWMFYVGLLGVDHLNTAPVCESKPVMERHIYAYGDNYSFEHWEYNTTAPVCINPNDFSCVNLFHRNVTISYETVCTNQTNLPGVTGIVTAYSWLFYLTLFMIFGALCVLFYEAVIKKW